MLKRFGLEVHWFYRFICLGVSMFPDWRMLMTTWRCYESWLRRRNMPNWIELNSFRYASLHLLEGFYHEQRTIYKSRRVLLLDPSFGAHPFANRDVASPVSCCLGRYVHFTGAMLNGIGLNVCFNQSFSPSSTSSPSDRPSFVFSIALELKKLAGMTTLQ